LIQEHDTKLFYKSGGKWTEKKEEAETFDDSIEAAMICSMERIHADLLLTFPESGDNLKIPLA
jgi:hypothetical protein